MSDKPLILIVDDSPTIRLSLARAVADEFLSVEAEDGEAAWDLLLQDDGIELLITDLSMPRLDGYDLIQRIRENDVVQLNNLPVIVVTGAGDTAARERAFEVGANDFLTKDSDRIELLARVRAHLKLAQTIRQLEESQRELREQANTDPLTGLSNRRFFEVIAEKELSLMRRQQDNFCVILLDIDHFKAVNDTHGHAAGDEILKAVAEVLSSNVREEDTLARIGGEEFVVCSPASNRLAAIVLAERLRKAVAALAVEVEGQTISVTISLGIALMPHDGNRLGQLMAKADERLYTAKKAGRDRFCIAEKSGSSTSSATLQRPSLRIDEALSMIRHGHQHRLTPQLSDLLQSLLPLIELMNEHSSAAQIDMAQLRTMVESLRD